MRNAFVATLASASGLFFCVPASADDWGCTVLLCLSNPSGAQAVAECVEPINRLWAHLRRGRPFPACELSDGSNSAAAGAYVRQRRTYYDPCPSGTADLAMGQRAASVDDRRVGTDRLGQRQALVAAYATGIGSGEGVGPGYGANTGARSLPPKVCVRARTGRAYGEEWDADGNRQLVPVDLYDRIVLLQPNASPRVIDVFIDNALARRVHW